MLRSYASPLILRSRLRTMATYIAPIHPDTPTTKAIPSLKPELWSTVPTPSKPSAGTTRVCYNTPETKDVTALVSIGKEFNKKNVNAQKELVRKAVGGAVRALKDLSDEPRDALVDGSLDPHAAAVGAHLALYDFNLKTSPPSRFRPDLKELIPEKLNFKPLEASRDWDEGVVYAQAQNFARTLMELPGNMLTPTLFSKKVQSEFASIPDTEVIIRDEEWASEKGMRTFLSVTRGTSEPAKFLEIHYNGAAKGDQPIVFVGKGITFDSGGISLKPGAGMKLMRGDMGGAAAVVSTAWAIAKLKLPVNLVVVTPLCENMPGPGATKPGDIIYAMNGKSVEVDNTDAEGRLVLADALYYSSIEYKPHTIIDVATLTGAMDIALGEVFAGVFSTSDSLWEELHAAGEVEYDRFWRMPLDEGYSVQISGSNADLCNTGGRPAGSCTAAYFLKSFVDGIESEEGESEAPIRWAHIDMASVMEATRASPYQAVGMTGRPVRALIEFVKRSTQVPEEGA